MDFTSVQFDGDRAYILPIGDIHFGDHAFKREGKTKLKGNLDWLREHESEARGIIMGDLFNIAGRDTKTSPYENNPREITEGAEFFRPYANLFVGAIRGNHERRVVNQYGFDPMELFCQLTGIPYLGVSAVLKVQVGARPASNWFWQQYYMYVHHTTGGGKNLGSALARVEQLSSIVAGCDVYAGGHNHQLVTGTKSIYLPTANGPKAMKQHYVSCGSYLPWADSYAEEGQYTPSKLGSPRIRFSGLRDKHDVHISV